MKKTLAALLVATCCSLSPATAQSADPKVDFLGYCLQQGNPTTYCGCLTDSVSAVLSPTEIDLYLFYLKLIASGERDQVKIVDQLKTKSGSSGKELAAMLQRATDAMSSAQKSCS